MREEYYELQSHLASYLYHIAKIRKFESIAIMMILKTERQVLTMMDYIDKHREECLTEEHLLNVAYAIAEQVD